MSVHHLGNFRGNPFTMAHAAFAEHVMNSAKDDKAGHTLVLTRSHDGDKNPLSPEQKMKHAKRAVPGANFKMATKESPTILHQASALSKKGVTHLIVHASSDRVGQFDKLLNTYNGKKGPHGHFKFKKIEVRQFGGDRSDKGGSGLEGVSATKMRKFAQENSAASKKSFFSMAPKSMSDEHKEDMWNDTKKGLQMESTTPVGIFLIGSPGSGKDYVLKNIFSRFDLTEVQVEHILNGSAEELLEQKKNIIINGPLDSENIATVSALLEGYHLENVYVAVTNKVSRLRNSQREHPISETKRIDKWLKAEKLAESMDCFRFNNSINLNESSDFEKVFFADQIEKLLSKLIDTGLEMKTTPQQKSFTAIRENVKKATGGLKNACWSGYTAVGMKNKNGKKVPNCVPVGEQIEGELKSPHSIESIAKKHKVSTDEVLKALEAGKKVETEHTKDERTAEIIALAHIWEKPDYYKMLAKVEKANEAVEDDKPLPKKLRRIARRGNRTEVMDARRQSVAEGKVSGYKMYRNHDDTWYVEDEDEGVVLRNASKGEAEHMVWSGNEKLKKGATDTRRQSVAEASSDYSRRREREEAIISGQKPARRKKPAQTSDYALRRKQERDRSLDEESSSAILDVNTLFEMQLVGTDAYRRHAIAMTPGQPQEIQNAFPVKNPAENAYHMDSEEDCECEDCSHNESVGDGHSGNLLEVGEIDTTPTLNPRKLKRGKRSPGDMRFAQLDGLPVTTARLAEAVEYHLENSIPFTENVFRPGSEMFFEMLSEAKRLYQEGEYTPADEWERDLLESDVGEKAIFEGREVILDYPFEEELGESSFKYDVDHMSGPRVPLTNTNCTTCSGRKRMYSLGGSLFADNKKGATPVICPTCKGTGDRPGAKKGLFEEELNESQEHEMIRKELKGLKTKNLKDLRRYIQQTSKVIDVSGFATKERAITHILRSKHGDKRVDAALNLKEDSDKTDGKGIGKPWREGGGGAVYVRSGDSVIKVSFSKSGMKKKYMDPGATRSFVARHRCLTNKDKTSSSYWACRWPRFFSNSGKIWW